MEAPQLHALIMAGGGGTRFWPRSRKSCPKQFLKLAGEKSLLQQACERIEALVPPERTWVITSGSQQSLVAAQLPHLPAEQILCEPMGRDTAACIGVGAAIIAARDPQAIMAAMPSDHLIEPAQEFRRALHAAAHIIHDSPEALVTLGIPPTHAATGYGYIRRGKHVAGRQGVEAYQIDAFREKPDAATAEAYLGTGQYYWNGGIFVWRTATLLAELKRRQPALHAAVLRIAEAWPTPSRDRVFAREFEPLKKLSIDYAVMEGCTTGLVIAAPFRWDDLGSWLALERMNPQDASGNTILGTHAGVTTAGCILVGEPGRLIATAGVNDLLIVWDGDALLVADKHNEGEVKKLVEHLQQAGWERFL
jgi:mannose-1-phosphate guanylyltransferase